MRERVVGTRPAFEGRILRVRVDDVESADGHRSTREVVASRGAAAVVCVHDGDLVLVRQYRHPVGEVLLEIPAGMVDDGESPEQTAARELVEEVGLRPRRLERLTSYLAAPGFTDHRVDVFLATEVEQATASPDEGEVLEVVRRPVSEIAAMIGSGEVEDAKTLIGLALYLART